MTTKDGYYVWEPASVSIIDQFIVLNTLSMSCDSISRTSRAPIKKRTNYLRRGGRRREQARTQSRAAGT